MYDDRRSRRYYRRYNRRQYRNPLGGVAAGIFIIGLAFAFAFSHSFGGNLFLPILFLGLAFCSLLGSASSLNPRGIYGGLQSFTWLAGLALCFVIGFWPWILIPVGVSMILGALYTPIITGLGGATFLAAMQPNQPPYQQPPYPQEYPQPPSQQGYQQGYQPQQQAPGTSQEGGQQYPQPKQEYDQSQEQPPQQQEMPPQQQ